MPWFVDRARGNRGRANQQHRGGPSGTGRGGGAPTNVGLPPAPEAPAPIVVVPVDPTITLSSDDGDRSRSDSDSSSVEGEDDTYYGGYGRCYNCGECLAYRFHSKSHNWFRFAFKLMYVWSIDMKPFTPVN